MFSGIVSSLGKVLAVSSQPGGKRLSIRITSPLQLHKSLQLHKGASLALNGTCLTVCDIKGDQLAFDVSDETLQRTLIGSWQPGQKVNLEPALRLGDEIGGHLVTGHIDGIGKLVKLNRQGNNLQLSINAPARIMPLVAEKGSIAIDGVSLTVNQLNEHSFDVMVVPWTLTNTIIGDYKENTQVHLEADILARYIARQLRLK